MRNWLTMLAGLIVASAGLAQPNTLVRARVPERTELDRLNLRMAWSISLPVEDARDGIATVQLIPVPDRNKKDAETTLLVAQTRSGTLVVYDAETGRRLWSRRPAPAYAVNIPEVAYDPRGALIVIRDLNLYRYDIYPSVATPSVGADAYEGKLITLPAMPSTAPVVAVIDPTKKDEGLLILCFNGNKLLAYSRNQEEFRYRPDRSVLNWKVHYGDDITAQFKPGDNKSPSLTSVDSVFGPDYGLKNRPVEPQPRAASLTMISNLARPELIGGRDIAATPSLTVVSNLTMLTELSRRDVREAPIDATSRRGDVLDFRIAQTPYAMRVFMQDRTGRSQSGYQTKIVLVGTDRDVQVDVAPEKIGLIPERHLGSDLFRSSISAPAAFHGANVFIPTQDGTIYSLDADNTLINWTATLQVLPNARPAVIGPHLFVGSRQGKLFRLNVDDGGIPVEGSFAADGSFPAVNVKQFLAASDRYVYVVDQMNNLVVLDRKRGTAQGRMDVTGYTMMYLNDVTDRVILGSNDGKLICLHDAGVPVQKLYRSNAMQPPPAAAKPEGAPPEGVAPPDKPAEKPPAKPAEKPPAKPAGKPAEKAGEKAAEKKEEPPK